MPEPLIFLTDCLETPIGEMVIVADEDGYLRAVDWTEHADRMKKLLQHHYGRNSFTLEPAKNPGGLTDQMQRYFAGELTSIDDLPVKTSGTPFQTQVWRALREIACGTTISYGKLANGSNPIGVVIPCHRVIGSDGSLTGYGGGSERKRWLLDHESKLATTKRQPSLFK